MAQDHCMQISDDTVAEKNRQPEQDVAHSVHTTNVLQR